MCIFSGKMNSLAIVLHSLLLAEVTGPFVYLLYRKSVNVSVVEPQDNFCCREEGVIFIW